MKIIHVEEQQHCTMLSLEMDDGSLHAHALPIGVLENRQGQWDLPDDVDPLDVLLVESHYGEDLGVVSPFDDDFVQARGKLIAEVQKHRGKIEWGTVTDSTPDVLSGPKNKRLAWSKGAVRAKCQLPLGIREEAVGMAKLETKHYRDYKQSDPSPIQMMAERVRKQEQLVAGYKRREEELKADDMMSSITPTKFPVYEFKNGKLQRKS